MNVFLLHESPILCARYHCDKHVVKMVIEYAQLLATAHRLLDGHPGSILRPYSRIMPISYDWVLEDEEGKNPIVPMATHHNHPCAVWARESSDNYEWLYALYLATCREYSYRYQRSHGASRYTFLRDLPNAIPRGGITPWPCCVPDELKIVDDSVQDENSNGVVDVVYSYRNYYVHEKSRFATWKRRTPPPWWPDSLARSSKARSAWDTMSSSGRVTGSPQLTLI